MACACTAPAAPEPETEDSGPAVVAGDDVFQFAFVVIADPHVVGEGEHADRLRDAVGWVAEHAEAEGIELVLLAGDIAWGDGLDITPTILDGLPVPWVPMIGDNAVQVGDEERWDATFGPVLDGLATVFEGWSRNVTPSWNPERGEDSWFQCFGFTHRGVRFVGLDWSAREVHPLLGELADLHEVEGGSLPFLEGELAGLADGPDERVVLLTHHPMLPVPGGFDELEYGRVADLTTLKADAVYADMGGHFHIDHEQVAPGSAGFDVVLTDASWDDEVRVRHVAVWSDGVRFRYDDQVVLVPRG